jgi:deoxyribonuclease IV
MKKIGKISIGAHVSAAGDLALAPFRAAEIGCECFQFFSRPPQGGPAKPITPEQAKRFKDNMKKAGQTACYIHAPYYINLASANGRIYHGSISVLRQELERGDALGAAGMMFHVGSARDLGEKEALKKAVAGLKEILRGYSGRTKLLLEISAGAGLVIGDSFGEIAALIGKLSAREKNKIGVCFDTAHAFASGYDLRGQKAVRKTFAEFDKVLGVKNLCLIHANDSKVELNAKKDRHENIGQGKIGLAGFEAIIALARKRGINLIVETSSDEGRKKDVDALKRMRDEEIPNS